MKQKFYLLVSTLLITANTFAATSLVDLNSAIQNTLTVKNSTASAQAPTIKFFAGRDLAETSVSSLPSNFLPSYV